MLLWLAANPYIIKHPNIEFSHSSKVYFIKSFGKEVIREVRKLIVAERKTGLPNFVLISADASEAATHPSFVQFVVASKKGQKLKLKLKLYSIKEKVKASVELGSIAIPFLVPSRN